MANLDSLTKVFSEIEVVEEKKVPIKAFSMITAFEKEDISYMADLKKAYEDNAVTEGNTDYVKICNLYKKLLDKKLKVAAKEQAKEAKEMMTEEVPDYPHVKFRNNGDITVQCHPENTEHLFVNVLGMTCRWNDLIKDMEISHGQSYLNNGFSSDNNETITYVEGQAVEKALPITRGALINHIALIGKKYRYHPVRDYLTGLTWNKEDYFEKVFDSLVLKEGSNIELSKMLLKRWLVMCVAAVLNDNGIAPQGALVLQGPQGIGKTTWLKRLMPDTDWFCEGMQLDPRNKDDVIQFVRNWVVELGEIDATFRKSDIAALKAFVTRDIDEYRPPYGATIERFPRRTCFSGTVNDMEFLSDDENRRFWVLPIVEIKRDIDINLDMFWAQIVELYRNGEKYWLDKKEIDELQTNNRIFKKLSPLEQKLEDFEVRAYDGNKGTIAIKLTLTEIFDKIGVKAYNTGDLGKLRKYLEVISAKKEGNKYLLSMRISEE